MKIIIGNVQTNVQIGGTDTLTDGKMIDTLRDYMSIKVPGSFFMQKHLKYHFDGLKHFLTPGGKVATGFLPILLRYIDEIYPDLEVEIIDERGQLPKFSSEFKSKITLNI